MLRLMGLGLVSGILTAGALFPMLTLALFCLGVWYLYFPLLERGWNDPFALVLFLILPIIIWMMLLGYVMSGHFRRPV